jgi:hypothetical protein
MSSTLTWRLTPGGEPAVELLYVLSIASQVPLDQYTALLAHLTAESIALCAQADYESPNSLVPQQQYCIASDSADSLVVFQCLPVPDYEGEPVPNFTAIVGRFQWLLVPAPRQLIA